MAIIDELRKTRIKKLEAIKSAGINPYPEKTKRTLKINAALKDFSKLSCLKKQVILNGRIRSLREHGGSTFLHFEDGSARIQAFFRKNRLGEKSYKFFLDNFDIGDFIEIRGILFKTKRGEKTIEAGDYKMLAKSLLPLPEKWHGLKDIEERYRKRYLDLIFNSEVKEKFILRTKIIKEIRAFLDKKGFLEVETPVLQPIYGGTKAKPFKTHLNALNMDLYLRVAPELYLKRLLISGFEKIYEIGRVFRNEGMDRFHNPDYTHFEFYLAYADYKVLMKFVEQMFKTLIKKVNGKLDVKYENKKINFKSPWQRIEFAQLLRKYANINLEEINEKAIAKKAKDLGIKLDKGIGKAEIADAIYKKTCRPHIWQPTFVIHHPLGSFPLSKQIEKTPLELANFQLVIAGWEIALGFSELNDSLEQRKRFEEQEKMFKKGFEEAQRIDKDFLEALEYGMPPSAGFGMGIDRLTALLTDSHSLREVILFPTMRPKEHKTLEPQKSKQTQIAVAIINKGLNLKLWEEMSTIAHLNAAFGSRQGQKLLMQDIITTKDKEQIKLNIQHTIMIKQAKSNQEILDLIKDAKEKELEIAEFTREMLETTDDKKVIKWTVKKRLKDIEYLGVLIFGKKPTVEQFTDKFGLYK